MLRRQVSPMHDTYNTVDSRIRHTIDVGLGQQNNFQRGAGYRSSLQDVHSSGSGVCYRIITVIILIKCLTSLLNMDVALEEAIIKSTCC